MGEVISIIKKREENDIMNNVIVRAVFIEELVDLMMLYNDTLIFYGITSEELSEFFEKSI
ncbi:MAG TPA: hypothetical protein DIU45_11960 [Clostridium sp.]|nr:hypothetical protein [Clostridium sp.]